MTSLSEHQYKATLSPPMRRLPLEIEPPFDFFPYFDAIPVADFNDYECRGDITYVWEDASAKFQHVLFNSQDKNVFMVVVLDLHARVIIGHRLLDLNNLYGLDEV